MKKLLAFHMDTARIAQLRELCKPLAIELVSVPPQREHISLGHLAGIAGISARAARDAEGAVAEEMLVFAGVDDAALDEFLDAGRAAWYDPVRLKAIVTPTNSTWSARCLYAELDREAAR